MAGDRHDLSRGDAARRWRKRWSATRPSSSWARTSASTAARTWSPTACSTEFGPKRVIDTPIAEGGFTGAAIGMAMMGMRPIVEMMTWNFSFQAVDQIIQNAAKLRYFSGGQVDVPLVIRGPNGGGVQLSAQHTHSLEGFYGHFPGLKVVSPVTPHDAKGMMLTAIRDPDPVIFLEAGALYGTKGEVPEGEFAGAVRQGAHRPRGDDVTLVGYGRQVNMLLRVADTARRGRASRPR